MPKLKGYIQEISERNRDCADIPVYSVTNSNGFVPSTEYFSKEVFSKNLSAYKIVSRNMLAYNPSRINVGSVACQDKEERVLVSPLYIVLQTDETRLLPEYLNLFLHSDIALQQIRSLTSGSVRDSLKYTALEQLFLPIPDILSQMKIMESLHAITSLISLRRQQLEKLQQLAKSRFVEMFHTKKWSPVRAQIFMKKIRNGVSPAANGKYLAKVLTLSAVTQDFFDVTAYKSGTFAIPPASDKYVTNLDFYICRGNGNKKLVGKGVYSQYNYTDLVFPDTVIAAEIDTTLISMTYLMYVWQSSEVRNQLESAARTTNGTYKINQQIISNVTLPLPPLSLQEKFASFIAHLDKSKFAIEESIRKLELLYRSKLQEYFG